MKDKDLINLDGQFKAETGQWETDGSSLETVGLLRSSKYNSIKSENFNSQLVDNGSEGAVNDIKQTLSYKKMDFDPIIEDDEGRASTRQHIEYKKNASFIKK